jgi:hypothetical protein
MDGPLPTETIVVVQAGIFRKMGSLVSMYTVWYWSESAMAVEGYCPVYLRFDGDVSFLKDGGRCDEVRCKNAAGLTRLSRIYRPSLPATYEAYPALQLQLIWLFKEDCDMLGVKPMRYRMKAPQSAGCRNREIGFGVRLEIPNPLSNSKKL